MNFEFPKKYKEFELWETDSPIDQHGILNEYQNGKYLIYITGNERRGFVISATNNLNEIENDKNFLDDLAERETIEEAWQFMTRWMDRNSLRSEL